MKKTRLYWLFVLQRGGWRNLDGYKRHTEEEAKSLARQWKRSGFKTKLYLAN